MMNNLPERTEGHLFEDKIWTHVSGVLTQAILISDSLEEATIVSADTNETLFNGRLVFRKSHDRGNPTRVLMFVDGISGTEIVVDENRLSR